MNESLNNPQALPHSYNGKLFRLRAVLFATLFGGPVAAALVISRNFYVLGQRNNAILTWVFTLLFLFSIPLVDHFTGVAPYAFSNLVALVLAFRTLSRFQEREINEYLSAGNPPHSNWWGAVIGLVILAITIALNYFITRCA